MSCLQNSCFKYREDLERLYLTYNDYDYEYQPFENLIELITISFSNKTQRISIIEMVLLKYKKILFNYILTVIFF